MCVSRLNVHSSIYSKRPDKLHARQVVYAIRLGTFNRHHRGNQDTIAFAYRKVKMPGRREEEMVPNLDVVRDRLLVPSSVTSKGSGYPVEGIEPRFNIFPSKLRLARETRVHNLQRKLYEVKSITDIKRAQCNDSYS